MRPKILNKPVTVTTVLEKKQHDALRYISFRERTPMAEIIRSLIDALIKDKEKKYPIHIEDLV